jgi:hypothetical protein
MAIWNCLQNLLDDIRSFFLGEYALLQDFVKQLSTLTKFCNNVVPLLVCENFVQLQNVWVIELTQNCDLILESLLLFGGHGVFSYKLDCSNDLSDSIDAFPNFSKSALTEHLSDLVAVSELTLILGYKDRFVNN